MQLSHAESINVMGKTALKSAVLERGAGNRAGVRISAPNEPNFNSGSLLAGREESCVGDGEHRPIRADQSWRYASPRSGVMTQNRSGLSGKNGESPVKCIKRPL